MKTHRDGKTTKGICEECLKIHKYCKNLCRGCYEFKKRGIFGKRHNSKPGFGCLRKDGYRILSRSNHPNATKSGRILEHVFVMSEYLGRPLEKHERIHHLNGIRNDNRIQNLELWTTSHPSGQRVEDKLKWCKEFIKKYEIM